MSVNESKEECNAPLYVTLEEGEAGIVRTRLVTHDIDFTVRELIRSSGLIGEAITALICEVWCGGHFKGTHEITNPLESETFDVVKSVLVLINEGCAI